jgi:hypothetical protein
MRRRAGLRRRRHVFCSTAGRGALVGLAGNPRRVTRLGRDREDPRHLAAPESLPRPSLLHIAGNVSLAGDYRRRERFPGLAAPRRGQSSRGGEHDRIDHDNEPTLRSSSTTN